MKVESQNKTAYRTGILLKDGSVTSKNTNTRKEADDFILNTGEVKVAKIRNNETGETEVVRF